MKILIKGGYLPMTIGDRIKFLREKRGITQDELSKSISSSKQTIYKYENNIITNIPSDNISKLANALLTTPGYLMGWTDEILNEPIDNNELQGIFDLLNVLNETGISKVKDYITDLSINPTYKK
jgi:transcriptional regulator with XRE-family HTH domain